MMHKALQSTQHPGLVLTHEGYGVLTGRAVESRFAFGNGFVGCAPLGSVSRGPTW
jgi:hypothetical protein